MFASSPTRLWISQSKHGCSQVIMSGYKHRIPSRSKSICIDVGKHVCNFRNNRDRSQRYSVGCRWSWWCICGPQLLPMENMGHRFFFFSLIGGSVQQLINIINVKSLISAPAHYSPSSNAHTLRSMIVKNHLI